MICVTMSLDHKRKCNPKSKSKTDLAFSKPAPYQFDHSA